MLTCPKPNCGITFKSKHAVETHMRVSHCGHIQSGALPHRISKKRRISLSSPFTTTWRSRRITIDRLTDVNSLENELNKKSEEFDEVFQDFLGCEASDTYEPKFLSEEDQEFEHLNPLIEAFVTFSLQTGKQHCNHLLSILRENKFGINGLLEKFKTIEEIRAYHDSRFQRKMMNEGFNIEKFTTTDGSMHEMFCRDPVVLLQNQISMASKRDIIFHKSTENESLSGDRHDMPPTHFHPMNASIGRFACTAAERFIKSSKDKNVCWKQMCIDGTQSVIGGLQIFSDKSQMSLNAGAVVFYPLHLTLVNFTEKARRQIISNGMSIAAYLPVRSNYVDEDESKRGSETLRYSRSIPRDRSLADLHKAVPFAVNKLSNCALQGFTAQTKEKARLLVHILPVSYVCDIPEAEDMLGMKRGNKTKKPCFRCLVGSEQLSGTSFGDLRSLAQTSSILRKVSAGCEDSMRQLMDLSMFNVEPVLARFPMVSIHPCVDVYKIFRVEPMHTLSLGISKMLKECIYPLLRDENRFSSAMCTRNGSPRPFNMIRRSILQILNMFLTDVQKRSTGYNLSIDFSKGDSATRLSGLFTDSGVIGMLEAKDFDKIDMVSPFLGSIIDTCCGLENDAPITGCFTKYVDLMAMINRWNMLPGWTEDNLNELENSIKRFKCHTKEVFGNYHTSGLGTLKWHALDHLPDDLRDVGGIEYLHCGIFESSHKLFKKDHRLTSQRKKTSIQETMRLQNMRISKHNSYSIHSESPTVRRTSREEAAADDGARLVSTGLTFTLHEIEEARHSVFGLQSRGASYIENESLSDLLQSLGIDGSGCLIQELQRVLKENKTPLHDMDHVKLCFPASAYISGQVPPSLVDKIYGTGIHVRKSTIRLSQRIVAKSKFYGTPRHDFIMIEGDDHVPEDLAEEIFSAWFAQALLFIRIPAGACLECQRESHCGCTATPRPLSEFCFVRYLEVVSDEMLPISKIDESLCCHRLRWHRTDGEPGKLSSAMFYGVIPVESIKGQVHLVRADYALPLIGDHVLRKVQVDKLCNKEAGWSSQLFYLNRFYRLSGVMYEHEDKFQR